LTQEISDVPYVLRPRGVRKLASALLGAATFFVVPAAAHAACASTPTTTPFTPFGDTAAYSLAPNGAFEAGASGWALTQSSVVNGSETYAVHAKSDTKSLAIQPTGLAVSPAICVDITRPSFRFFARRTSGTWATLNVKLRWRDASGATHDTSVGSLNGTDAWQPSPVLSLGTTLPLWNRDQTATVQLVFDPEDYGGAWAIDDVYIDPYVRG
jgi:hypothetical protein